jgi:transketolase
MLMAYTARYIPLSGLEILLAAQAPAPLRAAAFAQACRINCLYMIQNAGSGHIGTSFSSLEIMSWLHLEAMGPEDFFFSSKGHDAPALYSVLIGLGRMPFEKLRSLRRLGGLPGHPDVGTPCMVTNTGSLGMGISKARGMLKARRLDGRPGRAFVLLGDGELQEGQIYESLQPTANGGYGELTVIVDHNKIQSDTWVAEVSDLGDLQAKFAAFGWATARCNGNDVPALAAALDRLQAENPDRPKILVADTVKGKGVSFMENFDARATGGRYAYHSGALSAEVYARALEELTAGLEQACAAAGLAVPAFESAEITPLTPPAAPQRLVAAYGQRLLELGGKHPELVALDGDLALDCGIIPFREAFPERFVECGIAEQDMVSMAGGLALSGKLPVVHSFGCFLTTRPGEQIFNNASERTKILYAGSLVGLCPAGPGHSHQSVRDIGTMASMPGMTCVEPCCETETVMALDWAVEQAAGPVYLRLVSIPCPMDFALPAGYRLTPGRGCVLREGTDAALIAYGPVMLQQAWRAADILAAEGFSLKLVNLPWLNRFDEAWLAETLRGVPRLFTLDHHMIEGGQGQRLAAACARLGLRLPVACLGLTGLPRCGRNDEVLAYHGLDAAGIAASVRGR